MNAANRTWGDANRNYVPHCDLTNPLANGECGGIDNLNFGRNNPNAYRYDADVLRGWNKRNYTWQAQAIVQHELEHRTRPAPKPFYTRHHDPAEDGRALPQFQFADGNKLPPVLIAPGRVQQQVADRMDAESREHLRPLYANAMDDAHRRQQRTRRRLSGGGRERFMDLRHEASLPRSGRRDE